MKVHHIGYLVKDTKRSIPAFEALGYKVSGETVWDEGRKADICFLENQGCCVELVAPAKESKLYPLLKQYNHAPYHMCYCCDDLEEAIEKLRAQKYLLFLEPEAAPAIGEHSRVAFLIHAKAGMVELVEGS